jgi:hypothetical protein
MWKKLLLVCSVCCFSVAQVMAAAGGAPVPGSLTVEQIISRNIAARGGAGAWQQVTSMTMSGMMDVGKGMQVPYTIEMKRGRKVRVEIRFQKQTAVQVYDGVRGWKKRPFLGRDDVEPFTEEELQKASLDSDLDGPLVNHAAKGIRVELEGRDKVDGREAYKLTLILKSGQVRHLWIDGETFLEAKIDGLRRMDGKQRAIETYYRGYRVVEGLNLPFLFETSVEGVKGTEKINVDKVTVNPGLDDSLFAQLR